LRWVSCCGGTASPTFALVDPDGNGLEIVES
jgi:hypothetical protein